MIYKYRRKGMRDKNINHLYITKDLKIGYRYVLSPVAHGSNGPCVNGELTK